MTTATIAAHTPTSESSVKLNPKTLLLAVVLQQALGALWYSPILFFNPWIAAQGKTAEQIDASNPIPFVFSIAGSFLFATMLSVLAQKTDARSASCGAKLGIALAVTLVIPALATHYQFLGMSLTVVAVDGLKELVNGAMIGALMGACAGRAKAGA